MGSDNIQFQGDVHYSPRERAAMQRSTSSTLSRLSGGLIQTESQAAIFGLILIILGFVFLGYRLFLQDRSTVPPELRSQLITDTNAPYESQ